MTRNGIRDVQAHPIVEELIERSFTCLQLPIAPQPLLDDLSQGILHFSVDDLGENDVDEIYYRCALGVSVTEDDLKEQVMFTRRQGFSDLQIYGDFYGDYVDLEEYIPGYENVYKNLRPRPGDFSRYEPMVMYRGSNTPADSHDAVHSYARNLLDNAPGVVGLSEKMFEALQHWDLSRFVSPVRTINNAWISLVGYLHNVATHGDNSERPQHRDSRDIGSFILSIQLTDEPTEWEIGRDARSLEIVQQRKCELVIMDCNGLSMDRIQPLHRLRGHNRAAVLLKVTGDQAEDLLEALPELAQDLGWSPTPIESRNPWFPRESGLVVPEPPVLGHESLSLPLRMAN